MAAGEVDIGQGVTISRTTDKNGDWVGLIRRHPKKGGDGRCASAVAFDTPVSRAAHGDGGIAFHAVLAWEPLTLSPSLLCRACGHHGHIQNGRWVGD